MYLLLHNSRGGMWVWQYYLPLPRLFELFRSIQLEASAHLVALAVAPAYLRTSVGEITPTRDTSGEGHLIECEECVLEIC